METPAIEKRPAGAGPVPNALGTQAWTWWNSLTPHQTHDGAYSRGDRAALARLRRTSSAAEAALEPETIALFHRLGKTNAKDLPRVAALASVLAHVKENGKGSVASAIGPKSKTNGKFDFDTALVKPNRFRSLITAQGDNEIMMGFRRVVALMGGKANVGDLAHAVMGWDRGETGDSLRMNFAFDYYRASNAAPGSGRHGE